MYNTLLDIMWAWYYLHTNGQLIRKGRYTMEQDFQESAFVRGYWSVNENDPLSYCSMLSLAKKLGVNEDSLERVMSGFGVTDEDLAAYDLHNIMS